MSNKIKNIYIYAGYDLSMRYFGKTWNEFEFDARNVYKKKKKIVKMKNYVTTSYTSSYIVRESARKNTIHVYRWNNIIITKQTRCS